MAVGPARPGRVAAHIERREGDPGLYELVEEFFAERGLGELESCFSTTFVSNPASGEVVKGHAIVAAELGLCPFRGKVARDPELFSGPWSRGRGPTAGFGAMWRQALPLERLFMSFLETRAMNAKFHEAEVVLIGDPASTVF